MSRKNKKWLLYGAYGYTGKLIIKEALKNQLEPIIAGRNSKKLISLAKKYDLEYETFSLENSDEINSIIKNYDLLFNAAGPFKYTGEPLVKSCLKNSVDYLDITGEIEVFEKNFSYHEEAADKETAIISGVGFDVIPTDCMAVYISEQIENPVTLELGIAALSRSSPGTMKTMIESISKGTVIRKEGKLETIPLGKGKKKIQFQDKEREVYPISWGDVSTAFRSTGIPNITAYMPQPKQFKLAIKYNFLVRNLFKLKFIRKKAQKWVDKNVKGPTEEIRESSTAQVYVKVENKKGQKAEAWLLTPEAYKFTALSSVKCVRKVFEGELKGALTPAQAFGRDFVLQFPDTERCDTLKS